MAGFIWETVDGGGCGRKLCPGLTPRNGMSFPLGGPSGNCAPVYLPGGFLRPLLQGVDRFVHVEQISHNADDEEHRQITETEDLAANEDRRE